MSQTPGDHHADEESKPAGEVKCGHTRISTDPLLACENNTAQPVHNQINAASATGPQHVDPKNCGDRSMADYVRPTLANIRPVTPFLCRSNAILFQAQLFCFLLRNEPNR